MTKRKTLTSNLLALMTVILWGTTFISTKLLLKDFSAAEILFIRLALGYGALWLARPKKLRPEKRIHELYFAAAALCGLVLYQLLENIALTYTFAGNVSVIVAVAPFFTAILNRLFLKGEKLGVRFVVGFIIAISGIVLISFSGQSQLKINPKGDILSLIAAIIWAFYSVITKKISSFGYNTVTGTRRIFFYALVLMIPVMLVYGVSCQWSAFTSLTNVLNLLFLGLGASALCFVTWNYSLKILGPNKTSVYIYLVPVVTTITAAIILKENITVTIIAGIVLTLVGLLLSESRNRKKEQESAIIRQS